MEITPVNGDATSGNSFDLKKSFGGTNSPSSSAVAAAAAAAAAASAQAGKGSKLESALDKLGLGKRKVSRVSKCLLHQFANYKVFRQPIKRKKSVTELYFFKIESFCYFERA